MKVLMKVEDVALTVVRPSQISLRLGAMLDRNRRRRPTSRATKWLALLLTISLVPLLAAARTASDSSSPEKTVRLFVAALNASRFGEAARYVDGATPNSDFKPLRDMVSEGKQNIFLATPAISLLALTPSARGDKATVKVKVLVTVKAATYRRIHIENIALVRRGARWLMVPANLQTVDLTKSVVSFASLIRSPQMIAGTVNNARRARCATNLKYLAIAAYELSVDKEKLAITPQNFETALLPYARMTDIFRCPAASSSESYSFNGNLTNYDLAELSRTAASRLVMFYEGRNGQLDFRHNGTTNVAFVDSHVKAISREEAKTLRWKP